MNLPEWSPYGNDAVQIAYSKSGGYWWIWILLSLPFWAVTIFLTLIIGQLFHANEFLLSAQGASTSIVCTLMVPGGTALWLTRKGLSRLRMPIILSKRGMRFPEVLQYSLLNRPERTWDDVHSVDFSGIATPQAVLSWAPLLGYAITIDFKSGGSLLIGLECVSREAIEKLFESIERWSDISVLSQRAAILHRYLVCIDENVPASLTAIWTDALDSQFAATNFVPLKAGTQLNSGQYRVRMQLACSGLSAVYLAEKQGAVKVILKESVLPIDTSDQTRTKARQLFEREAALLAKLDHPRIVKVLDSFVEEGRDYIVLQYVPGINLRQMMQAKPEQDWHCLRKYALQIAEIVDYLHNLAPPIVHRDLTPDNLIINETGTITLIDFGASNEFVSQATGTLIGKQAYIPPEQFKGKASPASDIYAFGATMYFLATGEDPTPLSVSGCSEKGKELDGLISDCTQLDPGARPDAGALVDRCRQLCLIELSRH